MPTSQVTTKTYAAGALVATPTQYCGIVVRETAGAAAAVRVWDNATAASGRLLDVIALAANASGYHWFNDDGLRAQNGIFLETVSGAVEGAVFVA